MTIKGKTKETKQKEGEAAGAETATEGGEAVVVEEEKSSKKKKKKKDKREEKKVDPYLYISTHQRQRKKVITILKGAHSIGMKAKAISKDCSKRFACSSSVIRGEDGNDEVTYPHTYHPSSS